MPTTTPSTNEVQKHDPPSPWSLLWAPVAAVSLVIVMRWRRRTHRVFLQQYADAEICDHLRPAWELLKLRGHVVVKAGQFDPDAPLEIHLQPAFDPAQIAAELKLEEPVHVSDRNVLYCKEDWCELHPR